MPSIFPTTRRSVVEALRSEDAGERARSFDTVVAIYWKPVYKYARLTWQRSAEDAEDLTQGFFPRPLERDALAAQEHENRRLAGMIGLHVPARFH